MNYTMEKILEKALSRRRIDLEEGVELIRSQDLTRLGMAANSLTDILHPESYRTYAVDRNINYTNICVARCRFCAFSTDEDGQGAYVISEKELFDKIEETLEQGGTQILMQGGMHPRLRLNFFEQMIRSIKDRFSIHIHAFSPPEIGYLSRLENLSVNTVIAGLRSAGLDSIPGGGAEILVDRCRDMISPKKYTSEEWLSVMREAHKLGMRTTATMMFGHIETLEERVVHMDRIRRLQDETGGFTAFIPWTFQPRNTRHKDRFCGAFEYLKTQAVARLYLDNVRNIQSSWVTQGEKVGQMALLFGANDMGSLMIEENVVASAGTVHHLSLETIKRCIREVGFIPRQRNVFYEYIDDADQTDVPNQTGRVPLPVLSL